MKLAIVIPARMASSRFPGKPLYPFMGLPMIEHVRLRAQMNKTGCQVIVATCDKQIADTVTRNGGRVVMTHDRHETGSDRVAEAITSTDATHVMILQGDEPLVLPSQIDQFLTAMTLQPDIHYWNALAPLGESEFDDTSVVKALVNRTNNIVFMCRKSPSIASRTQQGLYLRKVLGIIGLSRSALEGMASLPKGLFEATDSIEQMRLIEAGFTIGGVPFNQSFPGVNTPKDAELVVNAIEANPDQRALIQKAKALLPWES